jgi:hypothetical protein
VKGQSQSSNGQNPDWQTLLNNFRRQEEEKELEPGIILLSRPLAAIASCDSFTQRNSNKYNSSIAM